jgi:ABC-type nitrate/sulfonate/bicarbonate transport system substrate-binding protein
MTTRRSLLLAGLGSFVAGTVGTSRPISAETASTPAALQKINVVIPAESVFVLNYNGAKDAGVFSKHGIDLSVDARPFAGFLAGLPTQQCMAVTYSGIDAIQKINDGVDWVIMGGGLTVVQDVIVLKESPFKTVDDLKGKRFGTFSTGAGSFKAARAAMIDAYKLDVVKDANLQQVAGPALSTLLERGQIDAMINISSLTIAAEAQPDKFRVLFSPNDYWWQKTGYPIAWAAPIVAWRSWVDQDRTRAKNFAAATEESFRWLRNPDNLETTVKKYGVLAGVTKPADVAEYKKWLGANKMFLTDWDRNAVDSQWKFLEVCRRANIIAKVPAADKCALFVGELSA